MMDGAGKIIARGRKLQDTGGYLLASEIVNKLVQAEPDNAEAKEESPRRHLRVARLPIGEPGASGTAS